MSRTILSNYYPITSQFVLELFDGQDEYPVMILWGPIPNTDQLDTNEFVSIENLAEVPVQLVDLYDRISALPSNPHILGFAQNGVKLYLEDRSVLPGILTILSTYNGSAITREEIAAIRQRFVA